MDAKSLCVGLALGSAAVCAAGAAGMMVRTPAAESAARQVSSGAAGAEDVGTEELKEEIYSRVRFFFGRENFAKLQSSFVIVVGLGGVGSHAANMLVRSGVTHIRLVDFDQVTLSSLNRHSMATLQDVGTPKVEAMRRYFEKLMPWCRVEAVAHMFKGEHAAELLAGGPDYVLDCIDDVITKAELIAYCTKNNIPVITSTGAGAKADPTKLRIGKLTDCVKDPLASKIKWKLKKHGVDIEQITTVFSVEKPSCNLVPLSEEQKAAPQDYGAVDYFRLRIMPVLGTSPAIFGQSMASFVACALAGYAIEPDCTERMSKNMRHKLLQHLRTAETRKYGTPNMVDIDEEELEFLIHQVWKNRCATTGLRIGGHASLVLSRWDPDRLPTVSNLVLTTQAEATKLESSGHAAFPPEVCEYIERRLLWARNVYEDDAFGSIRSLSESGEVGLSGTSRSSAASQSRGACGASGGTCPLKWFAAGALSAAVLTRIFSRS